MCINIPLVVIATRGFEVLSLFLVGNLLSSCAILPLIFGLIPQLRRFFSETGFVLGVLGGILGVTAVGIGSLWIPGNVAASFSSGAYWAWYGNNYDWKPFLAALACSAGVMVLFDTAAWLLRRAGIHGPGVSGILMRIPGMKIMTATPNWDAEDANLPGWEAEQQQHEFKALGSSSSTATAAGHSPAASAAAPV